MKSEFSVRRLSNHVEIEFSGLLVAETIVDILEEISWREIRSSLRCLLWDLRRADLSAYSLEDMTRVRAYDGGEASRVERGPLRSDGTQRFRIAAVFRGDSDQLILRVWKSAAEDSDDLERRSFEDIAVARRWIAGF